MLKNKVRIQVAVEIEKQTQITIETRNTDGKLNVLQSYAIDNALRNDKMEKFPLDRYTKVFESLGYNFECPRT